ncbi:MAG TPA: nicotinate-nucleotide--dimethylbenzimidazole phosphoribosyltransferase [Holophagaceae bacterium]|nr:nicotinate-nucleotide--dimethylbenzimidazole phosphoribosyltransferase [Holophagaceae bacterium]
MHLPQLPHLDPAFGPLAQAHLDDLTKPLGALGQLERVGLRLARVAGTLRPTDPPAFLLTFAGDHGIARHGTSAYPAEVTPQMVANLAAGGAASSVLCRLHGIRHRVVDVGVAVPCPFPGVSQRKVLPGTRDPLAGPAMTRAEAEACIQAGMDEVKDLPSPPFALLCLGEMGIGNSAVAALLACALGGLTPEEAVGPGTGVKGDALQRKMDTVRRVFEARHPDPADPVAVLAEVGGAEFGAMAGAMLAGAARGWAIVVDGYIAGAAALLALRLDPRLADFLIWAHRSAEPGAARLLESLGAEPVLDMGLRLGEGSGAALVVPILRSACAVMREMATFSGAGVSAATVETEPA